MRLFIDRATTVAPSFIVTQANAPAVAQVCHRLDGIPLAIELAAARVKSLPVEKIAERLDDRFRLLTGGSRTALPRQQTLRALIDWSYNLLTEAEQVLLRRLSVFAGGWTLEAAEAVCADRMTNDQCPMSNEKRDPHWTLDIGHWSLPEADVLDLLTALVEKSLVLYGEEKGESRYRVLETIRQYARDRLLESGEADAVRERHREWYLELAEQAESGLDTEQGGESVERLELEYDNLRAALAWSKAQGQSEAGLRLGGALWKFWKSQGYRREGRGHLASLLALPGAEARTAVRAKALAGAGWLAWFHEEYGAAQGHFEESLAIYRELENKPRIAGSLGSLGNVALAQGEYGAARALHEESLAIFHDLGYKLGIAWSLGNLGWVAWEQGDYGAARALFEETLAIYRELGYHKYGIAETLWWLGMTAHGQGDCVAARALLEQGLTIFRELGRKQETAESLEGLAAVAVAQAQPERAARLFGAAAGLCEAMGAPLPPISRTERERSVAAARAALGEEAFAAAWAEGRAMPLEGACAYALQHGSEDAANPCHSTPC